MNRVEHKLIDGVECKHCWVCKSWKPLNQFNKDVDSWDGKHRKCKSCKSEYQKKVRPSQREYFRNWANDRYKTNIHFKIKSCVQARIRSAIKNNYRAARTSELIGCSIEFLKDYLESLFDSKMSWENYGSYWHIDHINPCINFDLSDPKQQMSCFHYKNLQPLEAIENVTKRHKTV